MTTHIPWRRLFCGPLFLCCALISTSGCIVEVSDEDAWVDPLALDPVFVSDLRVRWTVDGLDDPTWCDDLGIETWLVEVRGAESLDLELSCRDDYWDSGSAFYGLEGGGYRVVIRALDIDGYEIISEGSRLNNLIDVGGTGMLTMRFRSSDF